MQLALQSHKRQLIAHDARLPGGAAKLYKQAARVAWRLPNLGPNVVTIIAAASLSSARSVRIYLQNVRHGTENHPPDRLVDRLFHMGIVGI